MNKALIALQEALGFGMHFPRFRRSKAPTVYAEDKAKIEANARNAADRQRWNDSVDAHNRSKGKC